MKYRIWKTGFHSQYLDYIFLLKRNFNFQIPFFNFNINTISSFNLNQLISKCLINYILREIFNHVSTT